MHKVICYHFLRLASSPFRMNHFHSSFLFPLCKLLNIVTKQLLPLLLLPLLSLFTSCHTIQFLLYSLPPRSDNGVYFMKRSSMLFMKGGDQSSAIGFMSRDVGDRCVFSEVGKVIYLTLFVERFTQI